MGGRARGLAAASVLAVVLGGCAVDAGTAPSPSPSSVAPAASPSAGADCPPVRPPTPGTSFDQDLHDELMAMLERDQAGRLGTGQDDEGDQARTDRLMEIIAVHGWPTFALVGEDAEDAAWAIAQHSDLDAAAQRCALEHLRAAVEAEQASPGNLAYLEDRVHAGAGEPQRYGTQVACADTGPEPATPLVDPARIDQFRASAGLPPFEDYLAEMAQICAEVS